MKKQNGFTAVEVLLILIIAGIMGGTGYYVWHSTNAANKLYSNTSKPVSPGAAKIANFDQCKKAAGSKILQTFPEVCVSKDGTHFSEPTINGNSTQYLVIREWGVKFPLSKNIADAYYTPPSRDDSYYNLRVHSLDSESDCTNSEGSVATISRLTISQYNQAQSSEGAGRIPSNSPKIGNYYYYIGQAQYGCTQNRSNDELLQRVEKAFVDETPNIQVE